jgi:regulator of replication initiation timing
MDEIDREIWDFINALNGNLKDQKEDMTHKETTIEMLSLQLAELCEENRNLKRENEQLKETKRLLEKRVKCLQARIWDAYTF